MTPKKPDSLMPFLSRSSSSEPTARMNLESEDVKGSNVMKEASRGTDTTDDEEVAGPSHLLSTQLQSSKDFKHVRKLIQILLKHFKLAERMQIKWNS